MKIQFYDVKNKRKVFVEEDKIQKTKFTTNNRGKSRSTFGLKSEMEGVKLIKFVSESDWNNLDVPEINR